MSRALSYNEIEYLTTIMLQYAEKLDETIIKDNLQLINDAAQLDYTIKTHDEIDANKFIPTVHSPSRLAVFLLHYYGELVVAGRTILIMDDDPINTKYRHNNSYILLIKDQHYESLLPGTPDKTEQVEDYVSVFKEQFTVYAEDNIQNTTGTHYESFPVPHGVNRYSVIPNRKFDFKTALYTSKDHTHNVDYIIQLDRFGNVKVFETRTFSNKQFLLSDMTNEQAVFLDKYKALCNNIDLLNRVPSWESLLRPYTGSIINNGNY